MRDPLLDDLDAQQRAAVTSTASPLAILAPAGSGKTRVLTRRIAYRIREEHAVARHVVALTFTRKAAGELLDRLRALGIGTSLTAGTFHAVALAQLRDQAAQRNWEPPTVLDRKSRVLAPLVGGRGPARAIAVNEIAADIEWAKARLIPPDDLAAVASAAGRRLARPPGELAELYDRYEREKRKRRLLDFDDVLQTCANAIGRDPEFAAAQHWRFRHFFVDEFQDTTPLQLRLLRAWLGERDDLCVVGDPAQAVYGFAGADAAPLREFSRTFPGGETIALVHNYRSTPAVVALAEAALGPVDVGAREHPRAVRPDGARPVFVAYDDDEAEASGVADRCWRAFTAGASWGDIAILFRTNAQSSLFEAALHRRGVPFRLTGDARFTARTEVRALIDRLREAERAAPGRRLAELLADLVADADTDDALASVSMRAHCDALVEFGREFIASGSGGKSSVVAFTSWIDTATAGADARGAAVDLVTFHRAKGLEWPVVFVTGLERGLVPVAAASSPEATAEERRLLHVACSRAEHELLCSWARVRTVRGRRARREPSPWLPVLEQAAQPFATRARSARAHIADLKRTFAEVPTPQPKRRPTGRQTR